MAKMEVIKRDGRREEVCFDKIKRRIQIQCELGGLTAIDPIELTQKISARINNGITTSQLDEFTCSLCASRVTIHPEYGQLAARIIISNHHKETPKTFAEAMTMLWNNRDVHDVQVPLISEELHQIVERHGDLLESWIDYDCDFAFDYFGFKTLEKAYLMRTGPERRIVERIQHMLLRVSLGLHGWDLEAARESYLGMREKRFIHATPTLFHAGTPSPQLLSCFLLGTEDSIHGIYKTISDCAMISKWAGGIGVHVSNIRSKGAHIRGTNGVSSGIIPMLRVYNATAKYVNQGGKRNGSIAVYLEPHHPDILSFLELKLNHGVEDERARDLFLALWLSDLFMSRVEADADWSLFDPDECRALSEVYGIEYQDLYERFEAEGRARLVIKARAIWRAIVKSQIETGVPYMLYKDHVNKKSNQMNLGTIKSSNLCAEIVEYSDSKEYACCTLASVCLPAFVKPRAFAPKTKITVISRSGCRFCRLLKTILPSGPGAPEIEWRVLDDEAERHAVYAELGDRFGRTIRTVPQVLVNDELIGSYQESLEYFRPTYDFEALESTVKTVVKNLNRVVDLNYYPVPETTRSNLRHRPLGLGVQGLADAFAMMRMAFDSEEALKLNTQIFETIYWAALNESHELALAHGPYETFEGSPLSRGQFQFELWGQWPSDRYDWEALRAKIVSRGVRNSLLVALMPTASTSQIMGNNECFEPFTSNMYTRRTIAGDFIVINKYLINDLIRLGVWNEDMKNKLLIFNGSVQETDAAGDYYFTDEEVPREIKDLYKTAWEIKQRVIIDMAAARGPFICQTQSMNLFFESPTLKTLTSAHLYGWKVGLKTGSYYIRSRPKVQAQQFTVDPRLAALHKKTAGALPPRPRMFRFVSPPDAPGPARMESPTPDEVKPPECDSCSG